MTNDELSRRAEEIGDRALDFDPGPERDLYITSSCGGDESLRARVLTYVRGAEEMVIEPVIREQAEPSFVGRRIGAWTLVRCLGEGGFGVVYLAERSDGQVRQTGAIKFLKGTIRGRDLELRFLDERQILANLNHPYIVGLIDAGVTPEGQPYLVMEVVEDALPIDDYCAQHSLKECLLLFRKVCEAVAYAHRKLVVHRDLKPGNILVTKDGTPRLLDFGVAKILDPIHRGTDEAAHSTNMLIGTERYWSPEQARRERVDTGTDVYSLGVILYELLVGRDPYEFERRVRENIVQIICTVEPEPPSSALGHATTGERPVRRPGEFKGDLDAILLKALRKEREQRYGSIDEFSDDIQRHLDHVPVRAHLNTFTYRVGRFIRRNRERLIAAVLLLGALIAGLATTIYQRRQALRNEHVAVSRELAAYAGAFLPGDPQRGLLLAMYAVEATFRHREPDVPSAETALHAAVAQAHASKTLETPGEGGLAFSPDGKLLATLDGPSAKLWEIDSEHELAVFTGHHGPVMAAAFTPDGRRLATCSADRTAKIWEAATGRDLITLSTDKTSVAAVAFSPDGKLLAIAGNRSVQVWSLDAERQILTLGVAHTDARPFGFAPAPVDHLERLQPGDAVPDDNQTSRIAISWEPANASMPAQGRSIFVGVGEGTTEEWDVDAGRQIMVLKSGSGDSAGGFDPYQFSGEGQKTRTIFSPDGNYLGVIEDSKITVWRPGQPEETAARFPSTRTKIWTASNGRQFVWAGEFDTRIPVVQAVFNADATRLATLGSNKEAEAFDVDSGMRMLGPAANRMAFSTDGRRLATASPDRRVRVWDVNPEQELSSLQGGGDSREWAFSPDGQRIAMVEDHAVKIRDTLTGKDLVSFGGGGYAVFSVAFSPDGKRVTTGGVQGTVKIWDAATGQAVLSLDSGPRANAPLTDTDWKTSSIFSPDGQRIVTLRADGGAIILWDAVTGQRVLQLDEPKEQPDANARFLDKLVSSADVAVSPDGNRVAGVLGGAATIWDAATGHELVALRGHSDTVRRVVFDPTGKRVATASGDGTAKIWDAATGRDLVTLRGHRLGVTAVAFSPDGSRVATASDDRTIRLWDAATGEERLTLDSHSLVLSSVVYTPDGKRLAAGSWWPGQSSRQPGASLFGRTIQFYALDTTELLDLARSRLTHPLPLTAAECQKYLHAQCVAP